MRSKHDALVADPEVLRNMEEPVLVEMAHELTDLIRRSRTVDWDKKQSARAYMRTQVKHLLRKYKYPPEKAKGAIDTVIKQAELMSANMIVYKPDSKKQESSESEHKVVKYDFIPQQETLMVAEEHVPYGKKDGFPGKETKI